jgi:hypothetical protein
MKAAASFQAFRTVFCKAIIIQQVQKNPENQENVLTFPENLKVKIIVSQDQENELRLSQCYQSFRLCENANAFS